MDGRQTKVAGGDGVVAVGFEVVQESGDHGGVEISEIELGGALVKPPLGEAEQQAEGVPISLDGSGLTRRATRYSLK